MKSFLGAIDPLPKPYDTFDAEEAVRSVFQVLDHRIKGGEIDDVRDAMPDEVRALWPAHERFTERRA